MYTGAGFRRIGSARAALALGCTALALDGCALDATDSAGAPDTQVVELGCNNTSRESMPGREMAFAYTGRRARLVHGIAIFESPQSWVSGFNAAQNYAIASVTNTTGALKTYQIKIIVTGWPNLSSTTYGIAWAALGSPG